MYYILSQKNNSLVFLDTSCELCSYDDGSIYVYFPHRSVCIGCYASRERANDILKDIYSSLKNLHYVDFVSYHMPKE